MISLALAALLQGAQTAPPQVQMGVAIRPETVTVGDHFTVTVRVRAPRGAAITFPVGPDSGGEVEGVDPRVLIVSPDSSVREETARFRLVAWDTGAQAAGLGDVTVLSLGRRRVISLAETRVFVRSVLPADTTLHIPKPQRDIFLAGRPWWHWLLAALIALALLGLIVWWWRRRRHRALPAAAIDPFEHAEREFARIDALRLLEAGERGRYVALNIEVLRDYMASRVSEAHRSLTSTEVLGALGTRRDIPLERLTPLLAESDLIKFARRPVSAEGATRIAQESRALVRDIERARKAAEAEQQQEKAA